MLKPPQPPPKPKKPLSKAKKPSSKMKSSSEVQLEDLLEEEELPATVPGPELPLMQTPRGSFPEPQKLSREKGLVERAPEPRCPGSQVVPSDKGKESFSINRVTNHCQLYKTIVTHMGDALTILWKYLLKV